MLKMERIKHEGIWFVVLTPDNPNFPAVAIEMDSELSASMVAWNIHRTSVNVTYPDAPEVYKVDRKP